MKLRCSSRIHGILREGELEVKCVSKHCGAGNGRIVFHYFDMLTGEMTRTERYQDPKDLFDSKKTKAQCR